MRLAVLRRQTRFRDFSSLIRHEDESSEREHQRVRAEMAKFTSEKALVWTFAPREVDRVCDLTLLFIFFNGT